MVFASLPDLFAKQNPDSYPIVIFPTLQVFVAREHSPIATFLSPEVLENPAHLPRKILSKHLKD